MEALDRLRELTVELDRAEAMFESLFEALPDSLIIVNSHGVIERVNTTAEATFGYERDEMVGQPVELLVPDNHKAGRNHRLFMGKKRGRGQRKGLSGQRKDGTTFDADIMLGHLETHNGPLSVCVVRDVSGRTVFDAGK